MKNLSKEIIEILRKNNLKIATMESCTSGSLVSELTNVEGSSAVVEGGYVTYSNEQKIRAGVSSEVIEKFGVYSKECALEMALISKKNANTQIGIGVTGSLGNVDLNNRDSKVGVINFAIVMDGRKVAYCIYLSKDELILSREEQKKIVVDVIQNYLYMYLMKRIKVISVEELLKQSEKIDNSNMEK